MPGLDPGIHTAAVVVAQSWMAGSSPAMTMGGGTRFLPKVVMPGLDPGIHRSIALRQPWMAGSSPAIISAGIFWKCSDFNGLLLTSLRRMARQLRFSCN